MKQKIQQVLKVSMGRELTMAVLSLFSIFLLGWYEGGGIGPFTPRIIGIVDLVIIAILGSDIIRTYRQMENKKRFWKTHWADIIGLVPLMLPVGEIFRLFRFIRVLRVLRFLRVMKGYFVHLNDIMKGGEILQLFTISAIITLAGSFLVWFVERDVNQALSQYPDALWWSVVTITTVGYGDVTPITALGRIIAGLLMLTGIGTIGLLASQVSQAMIKGRQERAQAEVKETPDQKRFLMPLERLVALHAQGFLTEAEFASAKSKLFDAVVHAQTVPAPDSS